MEIVGKKTCKQIQAGDVLEVSHNQIHYWDGAYERLVTVLSVDVKVRVNDDGQEMNGKTYWLTCSDGNTYEVSSRATKYRIYATEVK